MHDNSSDPHDEVMNDESECASTTVKEGKHKPHKGIYLLPNLFTTGALFSGFYAIVNAMGGNFESAAIAIFVAMVLDGLDGRVARMTHTESPFGAQFDSLSDMVSFGVAPALVVFSWALQDIGRLGWFAAFIYIAGAALRLARFNTQIGSTEKRYFVGVPSPAAAASVAGFVWMCTNYEIEPQSVDYLSAFFVTLVGVLMVSNILYYSFKDFDLKERVPFVVLGMIVLGVAIVSMSPSLFLWLLFFAYICSGPVIWLIRKHKSLK